MMEFPGAKKEGLKLTVAEQRQYILDALKRWKDRENDEYSFHGYYDLSDLRRVIGEAVGMNQRYTRIWEWGWHNEGTLEQYEKVEKILIRLIEQGYIKPSKTKTMFKVIKTK